MFVFDFKTIHGGDNKVFIMIDNLLNTTITNNLLMFIVDNDI